MSEAHRPWWEEIHLCKGITKKGKRCKKTMKDFVKGKIIMQCPKCGEHAPNLIFEGCFKCGFKPEVRSLCKPKRRGEWK